MLVLRKCSNTSWSEVVAVQLEMLVVAVVLEVLLLPFQVSCLLPELL
jgi:hypothetical protein